MPKKKKSNHTGGKLLTVGAAALGAYWLYGSENASKNRQKAKSWMLRAKAEALEAVERAKNLDEQSYKKIIDTVESKYKKLTNVDSKDLASLVGELKSHYNKIAGGAKKVAKKVTSKKTIKKTVKNK